MNWRVGLIAVTSAAVSLIQDEIEIEWNFDDIFQNRDNLSRTRMTYQKIIKVLGLPDGNVR